MNERANYKELTERIEELKKEIIGYKLTEKEHRLLAESLPDVVYEFGYDGKFTYINDAAVHVFGYSKDEILNDIRPEDMLVDKDRTVARRTFDQILMGKTFLGKKTFVRKDGIRFIGDVHARPIYKDKDIIGVRGIIRDITKSQRVKEEIRRLSSAVEQSIDGIAISDLELKMIYVNRAFAKMHGYTPDEMVEMKTAGIVEGEEIEKYNFRMSQVREHGSWTGEASHARKDKTSFPVYMSITLLKDTEEKSIGILGIARDIIDQKMIEDEMRKKDNAIASSINAIFFSTLDGFITYVNDSFLIMWGYNDEKEVLGKFNGELWGTEEEPLEGLEAVLSRGSWIGELVGKRKDGSLFDVQLSSSVVKNEAGKPICMMATLSDISENKKAEQALREREADLQIKTKSLEEVNTALKVLLKRRDEDKTEIEEKILINVKELVVPYLEKLKKSRLNADQLTYTHILESNLNNITSSFSQKLSSKYLGLTPTEIQVANLVKEGRTTKQIGELMNLSTRTIEFHRKHIRSKIGINNRKANLRSHLLSLQ